jgi:hypothetical protein
MKKFNQNKIQADGVSESNSRLTVLKKTTKKHQTTAIIAIFSLIVLHFVSQFFFFGAGSSTIENSSVSVEPVAIENQQIAEVKIEKETAEVKVKKEIKDLDVVTTPKTIEPIAKPQPKAATLSRPLVKRKEPRETRAERLRRVERSLTGI